MKVGQLVGPCTLCKKEQPVSYCWDCPDWECNVCRNAVSEKDVKEIQIEQEDEENGR